MKKLIVGAISIALGFVASAASYNWKAQNDWYSPDGNDDLSGTVYIFDGSAFAQSALVSALAGGDMTQLNGDSIYPVLNMLNTKYFILPFVKQQFSEDIKWLLKQNNNIIVKYLPLMLYFYASYSLMQTLMFMNKANWHCSTDKPHPITFMLSSERASEGQAAVKKGWAAQDHFPETFLNKMSAYAQALDILNSMFEEEEELMTFQAILKRFDEMEFTEESKAICEKVLNTYQDYKYGLLDGRDTEPHPIADKKEININSYEEFVNLLLDRCLTYQSVDYPRMKVALYSLVSIKMFEKRRDYSVLVLDEEMLLFLVAMMAKDDRIRIEDLYKRFHEYGIDFSFQTKNAISDYLLKLNLLERKSDSGEAQYVRVVF